MNTAIARKTLNYVAVNSALMKRALDEVQASREQNEKAAAVRDDVLEALVKAGSVAEHQRATAAELLKSPAETLQLLKKASEKLATAREQLSKQASDLGQAVEDPQQSEKKAHDSLTDPYVGRKTGEKKASDLAILKVLD